MSLMEVTKMAKVLGELSVFGETWGMGRFLENRRLGGSSPDYGQAAEGANTGPAERYWRRTHGKSHRVRKHRF